MNGDGEEGVKGWGVLQDFGDFGTHKGGEGDVSLEFKASH